MEKCIRAIYIQDIRFPDAPVFELDKEAKVFTMIGDPLFQYGIEEVLKDDDWIIFFDRG